MISSQPIAMLLLFVAEKMIRIHVSFKVNPSETDPDGIWSQSKLYAAAVT